MENKQVYKGPSSMFLLFLVLITLKLTNFISWSWWWVTAPLWLPLSIILTIIFIILIILGITLVIKKIKN